MTASGKMRNFTDVEVTTDFGNLVTEAESVADPQTAGAGEILAYFCIFFGAVGLVGNGFVILVIFNYTKMRKSITNMLIINQSIIDALSSLLLILSLVFDNDGSVLSGVSGVLLCRLWYSKIFLWGPMACSTFNLLAITFERFLCIVYPKWYKILFTRKLKVIIFICVTVWIFPLILQMLVTLWPTGIDKNGICKYAYFFPSLTAKRALGIFVIGFKFMIPLAMMICCYVKMSLILKTHVHPLPASADSSDGMRESKLAKARRNIIKTLIVITVCFTICWLPNQTIFFYYNLGYDISFSSWYYHCSVMLAYLNCCCSPFIYIAQYEEFQVGVRKFRGRVLRQGTVSNADTSMMTINVTS